MSGKFQSVKDPLSEALRNQAVDAAKRHKASWIELGRFLHSIYRDKHYREWGYLSFEAYCVKELSIKQVTASKLLKSYGFLEKEEPRLVSPQMVEKGAPKEFPDYEAVNLLRLAKENASLTPHDYAELREAVIQTGKEPKEVRAQVKQILAERDPKDPEEEKRARRNALVKRLISLLAAAKTESADGKLLPDYLLKQMTDLAVKLQAQIEG
ncbi:MAG TPA: hypothetical protein PKL97_05885 [Candidatus Omnitrophota bacterium]|nr:hypothetical protein [Candidatus Omnitrophota bacterium]